MSKSLAVLTGLAVFLLLALFVQLFAVLDELYGPGGPMAALVGSGAIVLAAYSSRRERAIRASKGEVEVESSRYAAVITMSELKSRRAARTGDPSMRRADPDC